MIKVNVINTLIDYIVDYIEILLKTISSY